ncbi:MAG: alkaline phosphatase D family protein [Myxococcota bacterium]
MKRRQFLQSTAVMAGGLVLGCDGDGGGAESGEGEPAEVTFPEETLAPGEGYFPQSVASGDPRPDGAILWTRVEDPEAADGALALELQLATDADFTQRVALDGQAALMVIAEATFDRCVKVRMNGLDAGATYHYRFVYDAGGTRYSSRVGRFKTAPALDADAPVRFAVVSCQDFIGKHYNVYRRLVQEDLDFFVHLGDYIYETTGDASFQAAGGDRSVSFTDEAGAIELNPGTDSAYFAARSLSNYRDLYKTFRSDSDLQAMHEATAMVAIWDDHEFSDDSWGTHATYFDGAQDEDDPERRQNADRAWFEYMPVDYPGDPDFVYEADAAPFPDDMTIYRDLRFGRHLHLVMTDLRRYRSDHIIPEDGFPGAMAVTQDRVQAALGELPEVLIPYVTLEGFDDGRYATLLEAHAEALGIDTTVLSGPMSVGWINDQVTQLNEALEPEDAHPLISDEDAAEAERGIAYHQLFKANHYGIIGSRYLVTADPFDVLAKVRWIETEGASETAMGATQREWFIDTVTGSDRTWKVWGNEFVFMPHGVDLEPFLLIPPAYKKRFHLSVEDWDGMPNRRKQLLEAIGHVDNLVAVTGDIHAFFAGVPAEGDASLVEFVTGAVSSGTYKTLLVNQAQSDPDLVAAGVGVLAEQVGQFLTAKQGQANTHLAHQAFDKQGCMTLTLDADQLEVTFWSIDEEESSRRFEGDDDALDALFERTRFRLEQGDKTLYKDVDGAWLRWVPETMEWT